MTQKIDRTPWTYHFSRYLGRTLTPAEKAVIAPLEKARHYRNARPTIVIDPPGRDSSELLIAYLHYRLGPDDKPGLLYVPNRREYLATHPKLPKHISLFTARNVNAARGRTPWCILMLHVEQYKTASPLYRYTDRWNDLYRTVWPLSHPWGFFIIHIKQTQRDPGFPAVLTRLFYSKPPKDPTGDADDNDNAVTILNPDAPPDIPIIILLPAPIPPPAPSPPRRR